MFILSRCERFLLYVHNLIIPLPSVRGVRNFNESTSQFYPVFFFNLTSHRVTMSSTGCLIPSVNALFAGLSALSSLFFMIGALGYTDKGSVMEDIAWIKADFYGSKYYFSLSAVYYDFGNLPVQTLEDCAPYSNYCDYCMNDGHSAYVMTVIACLTAIIAATLSVFLVKYSDFLYLHYALIAVAGFSFLMAAIALCVFMGKHL